MKKLTALLIIIGCFISLNENVKAQDFSAKNKMIIYSECQRILNDYQKLINQLGESGRAGFEASVGMSERLMELFINRKVLIYNDLDPQHKLSEFYELETYTSNMVLWYPDGIQIALDLKNARTSDIRKHDEGLYSTDIKVNKKMVGNYLNKSINSNTEELIFRIAFTEKNNNFGEFRIVGVRSSKSTGFVDNNKALYALKSIDLTPNEREKVNNEYRQLLNDYQRSLLMLGDPNEAEEDKGFYREAFLNLFTDSTVKIFNDIEEKPDREIITIEEYLNNYRNYYPEGIKNLAVNIDSAEFGDIIPADDGGYYSYVYADKFFSGKFQNKNIFRLSANLVFKIIFRKADNVFTGFKIENIDRSGLAFFQGSSQTEEQAIPQTLIQPINRKGFHLSPYFSAGYSSITNKNIRSLELETNYHEWKTDQSLAFSGGINVEYLLNNKYGISIGAGYGQFATTFSLHGNFEQDFLSYTEKNNVPFLKHIDASLDSSVKLSYIQFPIQLIGFTNDPQKTGFYYRAGLIASVFVGGKYNFKGDLNYYGISHEVDGDTLYVPELGFYNEDDHSGSVHMNRFFLSGTISFGVNIPVAYFTTIQIGPVVHVNLIDLSEKTDYMDIFGTKYDHKPVSLNYLGLEIGIRFL
jgi:hypothetical protein